MLQAACEGSGTIRLIDGDFRRGQIFEANDMSGDLPARPKHQGID
jgi:hypothetical protein